MQMQQQLLLVSAVAAAAQCEAHSVLTSSRDWQGMMPSQTLSAKKRKNQQQQQQQQ
jgi:hypothetical protein